MTKGPDRRNRRISRLGRKGLGALLFVALLGIWTAPAQGSLASLGYSVLRWFDRADIQHHDITVQIDPREKVARFEDVVTFAFPRPVSSFYILLGKGAEMPTAMAWDTGEALTVSRSLDWSSLPFTVYRVSGLTGWSPGENRREIRFDWVMRDDPQNIYNPFFYPQYFYVGYPAMWYPHTPAEDFFDAEIRILVPAGHVGIADGELVQDGEDSGEYVFRVTQPVDRLGVGSGPLRSETVTIPGDDDAQTARLWMPANRSSIAHEVARHALATTRFLEERLGPLPRGALHLVEMPFVFTQSYTGLTTLVFGGNLEAVGLVGEDGRAVFAAHESAHGWLGGLAGIPPVGHAWLVEGLAEYLAHLALASYLPEERAARIFEDRVYTPFVAAHARDGRERSLRALASIEVFDTDSDLLFHKGALVFRMLHRRLGDERFFEAVSEFVRRNTSIHGTGRDFETIVAGLAAPGERTELSRFFRDWVRGSETLDYALEVSPEILSGGTDTGEAQDAIRVTVRSVGALVEPGEVEILIVMEGGLEEIYSLPPGTEQVIGLSAPALQVQLDPYRWLADSNPSNNTWVP